MAFKSSGSVPGSLPIEIGKMIQLKVQRPGIRLIGHQHIQHRYRLQGREVSRTVSHGTVRHFQQVYPATASFAFVERVSSTSRSRRTVYMARSSRRPRLMKSQPDPRVIFSRSIPEEGRKAVPCTRSSTPGILNEEHVVFHRRQIPPSWPTSREHTQRQPLPQLMPHPLQFLQRRYQTVLTARHPTSAEISSFSRSTRRRRLGPPAARCCPVKSKWCGPEQARQFRVSYAAHPRYIAPQQPRHTFGALRVAAQPEEIVGRAARQIRKTSAPQFHCSGLGRSMLNVSTGSSHSTQASLLCPPLQYGNHRPGCPPATRTRPPGIAVQPDCRCGSHMS